MFIVIKGPEIAFCEWLPDSEGNLSYFPMDRWFGKSNIGNHPCVFIPLSPFGCMVGSSDTGKASFIDLVSNAAGKPQYLGVEFLSKTIKHEDGNTPYRPRCDLNVLIKRDKNYLREAHSHVTVNNLHSAADTYMYEDRIHSEETKYKKDQINVFCNNGSLRKSLEIALDICPTIQEAVELAQTYTYAYRKPVIYTTLANMGLILDMMYVFDSPPKMIASRIRKIQTNKMRQSELFWVDRLMGDKAYMKLSKEKQESTLLDILATPYKPS